MLTTPINVYNDSARLTPENTALLLIDHQTGLMPCVQDIDAVNFKNNAIALAKIGKIWKLPVVITQGGGGGKGPNGPIMQEIIAMYPDAEVIDRYFINSWDEPNFRTAVEQTGRKKLIMAGVTSDVCLAFPAMSAVAAGYDVYAVVDASGCWNWMTEVAAMIRMAQAGVIVTNWVAIAAELNRDWRRPEGTALSDLFANHMSSYGMIFNNFSAQGQDTYKTVQPLDLPNRV
jgi:nicotinamidase-related amidase